MTFGNMSYPKDVPYMNGSFNALAIAVVMVALAKDDLFHGVVFGVPHGYSNTPSLMGTPGV